MVSEQNKFKFSGHETFAFRFAWLPKAVLNLEKNHSLFLDENQAMVELGVGKNMVKSIKFWGQQTGVIATAGKEFVVTPFGSSILGADGFDPYLEDQQTLWLLHWKLATNHAPLFAWFHLLNKWQEPEMTQNSILLDIKRRFGDKLRFSDSSLRSHVAVFFHTYTPTRGKKKSLLEENLDCPLVQLHLLEECGSRLTQNGKHERVYQFRRDSKPEISPELFAYCLMEFWLNYAQNEETLSFHEIAHSTGSPGQIFKFTEQELKHRIENIEEASDGMISFMPSALLKSLRKNEKFNELKLKNALKRIYV